MSVINPTYGFKKDLIHYASLRESAYCDEEVYINPRNGDRLISVVGAIKKNPQAAIQITIARYQIDNYGYAEKTLTKMKELGFVEVFHHVNPNTNEPIYTFMRTPDKPNKHLSYKPPPGFYKDLWENIRTKTVMPVTVTGHAGYCCGWSNIVNMKFDSDELGASIDDLCMAVGKMHVQDNLNKAFQFIVDEPSLNSHYKSLKATIEQRCGFRSIFSWVGVDGVRLHLYAYSKSEQPVSNLLSKY